MTAVGRVVVVGVDAGAGMAVGPRLIVTANHVIRGRGPDDVTFRPAGGDEIVVTAIDRDESMDVAVLHLGGDMKAWLTVGRAVEGAEWRADSPPAGNAPRLTGRITRSGVSIENAGGHQLEVLQLHVDQELGDYRGYSGCGVLDVLGRTVVGVLIEQTHLRLRAAPGDVRRAANVLYALPIRDVAERLGITIRTARPVRFDVPSSPGLVDRGGLLDRLVAELSRPDAAQGRVVRLWGYGGMGKTVLATQAGHDVRTWQTFPGGIHMITAGDGAGLEEVRERLRSRIAPAGVSLRDALSGDAQLLIVDDVWSDDVVYGLAGDLPESVTLMVTTRGVTLQEDRLGRTVGSVHVGEMLEDEAIRLLARSVPRTADLDGALLAVARTLASWALLLDMAATELHDDELEADDPGARDPPTPADLMARALVISDAFASHPTMLDDPSSQRRSFDRMVRRSLERLGDDDEQRYFFRLAIYPPDAELGEPVLADLWELDSHAARTRVRLLRRVGLVTVLGGHPVRLRLHDLIVAWLHREFGGPDDPHHHRIHRRCAALAMKGDGTPADLTAGRADWLAFHLGRTGNADDPLHLLGPLWWAAYRGATGTDAVYLEALRRVALELAGRLVEAAPDSPAFQRLQGRLLSVGLLHAYLSARVAQIPVRALVTEALLGQAEAALREAASNPDPVTGASALGLILSELARLGLLTADVCQLSVRLVSSLRSGEARSTGLAAVAEVLATTDPDEARRLIERAADEADAITDSRARSSAIPIVVRQLAAHDPVRAISLAMTIELWLRPSALLDIVATVAVDDPDPAIDLVAQADWLDREALEAVAGLLPPGRAQTLLGSQDDWIVADAGLVELARQDPKKALAKASRLLGPWARQRTQTAIAEVVAESDVDWALEILESQSFDALDVSWAQARIAEALAGTDPEQAVTVAESIGTKAARNDALSGIAKAVGGRHPEKAFEIAKRILDRPIRQATLADVAVDMAVTDRARAVELASTLTAKAWQSRALAGIAVATWDQGAEQARALIDRSFELAQGVPQRQSKDELLAWITTALAERDPTRAVELALTIDDLVRRSAVLASIAEDVVTTDADTALRIAGLIPKEGQENVVVARLAAAVLDRDPARARLLNDRAVELSTVLPPDEGRDEALVSLAIVLAGTGLNLERDAVLGMLTHPAARLRAVGLVAARIWKTDVDGATALVERAVIDAGAYDPSGESDILAAIGSALWSCDERRGRMLLDRAIALAQTIPGKVASGRVLAEIADGLAGCDVMLAVDVALGIAARAPKSEVLAQLLPLLAEVDPMRAVDLLPQIALKSERSTARIAVMAKTAVGLAAQAERDPDAAIEAAMGLPNDGTRSRALAAVAQATAPRNPKRAMELCRSVAGSAARARIRAGVACGLATGDPNSALTMAKALSESLRAPVLVAAAAALWESDPGRASALVDEVMAMTSAGEGSQWDETLTGLVTVLLPRDPERALRVAAGIRHPYTRMIVVGDFAQAVRQRRVVPTPPVVEQSIALLQPLAPSLSDDWFEGENDAIARGRVGMRIASVHGYLVGQRERPLPSGDELGTVWWRPADALRFVSGFFLALDERASPALAVAAPAVVEVIARF